MDYLLAETESAFLPSIHSMCLFTPKCVLTAEKMTKIESELIFEPDKLPILFLKPHAIANCL